jgi:hypothetical protein
MAKIADAPFFAVVAPEPACGLAAGRILAYGVAA